MQNYTAHIISKKNDEPFAKLMIAFELAEKSTTPVETIIESERREWEKKEKQ
jgi:hypothetical protein